jgi:hypothetical protein
MIKWIMSWLGSGAATAIGEQLNKAYAAKLNATTEIEKIELEKRIAELHAQQAALAIDQADWATKWIRPALAFPVVFYMNKVFVWDKGLGLGTTPDLTPDQWVFVSAVSGAYLLSRTFEKVLRR